MAITPKGIQEIRAKRAQLKKNRKERLALEATDPEVINNAVTEDSKPQGKAKLPSLILKQGQKLGKLFIPLAVNLIKQYGIDQAKQEIEAQELSVEDLRDKFCPTDLPSIVQKRNDAVDYLNKTGERLDSLSITVDFGANFAGLIQGLVKRIKQGQKAANLAMTFIPLALPGAVPATINTLGSAADSLTFNEDGTPKLPPLTITASQVSPSVASTQSTILKCTELLGRLDILINLCDPNANLQPINDSIQNVVANEALAEASSNDTTYKGFILEIETKPYTDRVNQNRAVGKNKSGIILISTDFSFASDPQVLITELKFIIDKDDLKAY
jgi:hypothetical protein